MNGPMNFGSAGNPFEGFDNATGFDGFDLDGFDKADGTTNVPAGIYICRIERGELTKTKTGKTAYRLCFKTVEPTTHAGFTLWRWLVLADSAGFNRAKKVLAPLGLTTSNDLRATYPPIGKEVFVKAMVTLKNDPQHGPSNDVERFEPCDPPTGSVAPVNPFAVLPPDTRKEGGNR